MLASLSTRPGEIEATGRLQGSLHPCMGSSTTQLTNSRLLQPWPAGHPPAPAPHLAAAAAARPSSWAARAGRNGWRVAAGSAGHALQGENFWEGRGESWSSRVARQLATWASLSGRGATPPRQHTRNATAVLHACIGWGGTTHRTCTLGWQAAGAGLSSSNGCAEDATLEGEG